MKFKFSDMMQAASDSMTDDAFQGVATALSESRQVAREELQKSTSAQMQEIIKKLGSGNKLSPEEIALTELWIVGDAQSYVEEEKNYKEWMEEYNRLWESLAGYDNKNCSTQELFALSGLLEDATRISYNIANFLEKKERIDNFRLAVSDGLDKEEREALVDILRGKLKSADY
jgi:hypothetical protein